MPANETPLGFVSYPDKQTPQWYTDDGDTMGLESWLAQMELLGLPTYATFTDLPDASTTPSYGDAQQQFAAVAADRTVYRSDGTEWVPFMGQGTSDRPLQEQHVESLHAGSLTSGEDTGDPSTFGGEVNLDEGADFGGEDAENIGEADIVNAEVEDGTIDNLTARQQVSDYHWERVGHIHLTSSTDALNETVTFDAVPDFHELMLRINWSEGDGSDLRLRISENDDEIYRQRNEGDDTFQSEEDEWTLVGNHTSSAGKSYHGTYYISSLAGPRWSIKGQITAQMGMPDTMAEGFTTDSSVPSDLDAITLLGSETTTRLAAEVFVRDMSIV